MKKIKNYFKTRSVGEYWLYSWLLFGIVLLIMSIIHCC